MERSMYLIGSDEMVVVQDQCHIVLKKTGQIVEEAGQHVLVSRLVPGSIKMDGSTNTLIEAGQRGLQIGEEACEIAFCGFEREPGCGPGGLTGPVSQQSRLAGASCRRNQRDRSQRSLLQTGKQVGARDMLYRQAWKAQFGG